MADLDRVLADDRDHVFHSWSAQSGRSALAIERAEGSYLYDYDGRRYLDFSSQLVFTNVGHQHPRLVAAIQEQAARLCTIGPQLANDKRGEAARLISHVAPAGMNKVFFTNGGTEAIEHAVRLARLHTGRPKLISAYRSYHGATTASIHLTGDHRRWANDTGSAGVVHVFGPYLYRSAFGATTPEEEATRALDHLDRVLCLEGVQTIAAILLETVPGSSGILPPPPGYLAGVRELCDRYGIVLIFDEVMCGFGRTGRWLALDHWGVAPDLITFAKGVNSGYVPLGGVIIADPIAADFEHKPYPGGLTYSGHPLACAAAVATIHTMRDEHIVENAADIGERVLGPGLADLAARHPSVGEVRGLGVFWALELVTNRDSRAPLAPYGGSSPAMTELSAGCLERGLLALPVYNRLHLTPPCTLTEAEAKEGLAILDEALALADAHTE